MIRLLDNRLPFLRYSLHLFFLSVVVLSCKKDGVPEKTGAGNPGSEYANISYVAKASGAGMKTTISSDSLGTVKVDWSSASVYVEKIAFTGKSSHVLDTMILVGKNLDIFSANALAGIIKLPSGSYKDVNIRMYCRKSLKSELAFNFRGTFVNTRGGIDSVVVGSSLPFDAALNVADITIDPSADYRASFNFDLTKVLTGITTDMLLSVRYYRLPDGKRRYTIWKGGSADEPFYNEVIKNWQGVASVVMTKE